MAQLNMCWFHFTECIGGDIGHVCGVCVEGGVCMYMPYTVLMMFEPAVVCCQRVSVVGMCRLVTHVGCMTRVLCFHGCCVWSYPAHCVSIVIPLHIKGPVWAGFWVGMHQGMSGGWVYRSGGCVWSVGGHRLMCCLVYACLYCMPCMNGALVVWCSSLGRGWVAITRV